MGTLMQSLLIGVLLYTFYEDSTSLQVSVWIFPVLFVLWGGLHLERLGTYNMLTNGLINTLLLGVSMIGIRTYSLWRNGKFLNHAFGLGDLLFLFVFAWGFSPVAFLWIWLLGTLAALVVAKHLKIIEVPYAGFLAFCNALLLGAEFLFPDFNLYFQNP